MDPAEPAAPDARLTDIAVDVARAAFGLGPALLRRTFEQLEFTRVLILKLGCSSDADDAAGTRATLAPVVPLRPDRSDEPADDKATVTATKAPSRATTRTSQPAGDLAIPSYDELAASQVIPLLEGLRSDELEAVRRHEAAGRGRRTVLSRIAQLQAG